MILFRPATCLEMGLANATASVLTRLGNAAAQLVLRTQARPKEVLRSTCGQPVGEVVAQTRGRAERQACYCGIEGTSLRSQRAELPMFPLRTSGQVQ